MVGGRTQESAGRHQMAKSMHVQYYVGAVAWNGAGWRRVATSDGRRCGGGAGANRLGWRTDGGENGEATEQRGGEPFR